MATPSVAILNHGAADLGIPRVRLSADWYYTIRSETQLMEQLHYNLLYRWFVGLGADEPVWVPTVFTKNRERLLQAEVAHKFLAELLTKPQRSARPAVGRTLLGRRHPGRSLGVDEELPRQGRLG
jgi:hypothetical protein